MKEQILEILIDIRSDIDFVIVLLGCSVWLLISYKQEKAGDKDGTYIRQRLDEMTIPKRGPYC